MQPFSKFLRIAGKVIKKEFLDILLNPITNLVVDSSKEIVTTVGSYIVESVLGKFQKSIKLTIYQNDPIMEEAFYKVMRKYNKIEEDPKLIINDLPISRKDLDDSRLGYAKGYHNLKYKHWNIILIVEHFTETENSGISVSSTKGRSYTLISFDFQNQFVKEFKDEIFETLKTITKANPMSKYIPVYSPIVNDSQYICTTEDRIFFMAVGEIPRRNKNTVFIPDSQMNEIETIIERFINNRDFYIENSIPYTLNILLYGPPGTGKDTIIKMIASKYNRSLVYLEDNKGGANIPGMLTSNASSIIENPLFVISDIDKYPALITETEVDLSNSGIVLTEQITNKGLFGKMINALDGVVSLQGRIVVMTTNYINKFDPAFLRDGRVGLKIELGYVTNETFRKFFEHYFKNETLPEKFTLKSKNLTIATLQSDIIAGITVKDFLNKYLRK